MSNVNNYIQKQVIQTKSVEFMPSFYFSLFAFLGSLLWLAYGAISRDIIIMVIYLVLSSYVEIDVYKLNHIIYSLYVLHILQTPNFVGVPLALGQMVLHCIYRDSPLVENAKLVKDEQLESITEDMKEDIRDYTDKTKSRYDQDIEMQSNV